MEEKESIEIEVSQEVVAQETEAKQFGWVPQDDFKGDPEQWRDAATFLQRGKEINGFLRKDLEKIQKTLQQRDHDVQEMRETLNEFREFHNASMVQAKKTVIDELRKEKVIAIEQGDGEKVLELEDKIEQVKEAAATKPATENKTPNENDKEFYGWLKDNQWYITDQELARASVEFGAIAQLEDQDLRGRKFLDLVTEKVKEAFPEKFENPARKESKTGNSSDGRNPSTSKKKKTYNDLPQEGKIQCDKFVKQGLMTQEQYVSQIDWDNL